MPHSAVLGIDYEVVDGNVIFADGTSYTGAEMRTLTGISHEAMRAVHAIKRAFGGKILPRQER